MTALGARLEATRLPRGELWRRLRGVMARQKGWIGLSFVLLLLASGCRLAQPWILMRAIDRHLIGAEAGGFGALMAAFAGVAVVEMGARWLQQLALETAGQRALLQLRRQVFAHLQRLPAAFFDRTPIGRLVGRVTTDVEALQEMFSSGVVTILGDVVFLIAAVCLMLSLSPPLTGATLLVVPVLVAATMFIRGRVRTAYTAMRGRLSELNGFLHEQVSGMPVVQMFGQEERRAGEFGVINDGVRAAQLRSVWWESLLSAVMEMLGSFTTALILWYGGGVVLGGLGADAAAGWAGALTLGTLFAFVDTMQKFFGPVNDLSLKYTVMQNAFVASDRIFALLDEEPEPPEPAGMVAPEGDGGRRGALAFEGVTFSYGDAEPVLHDVSFAVEPGETVALVGVTGSGKSTILSLLTRLYELQEGRITLDGVDVRQLPRADLRRRIGVVPQDPFLFHGTILDNLLLGQEGVSEADAIAAASRLHLDEVVARFPAGYHEPIAERGKNLSAGEKQLVAFARMLVIAPEVLLLDEATASVDTHTEHLLQDAVRQLMAGRTSLIVAHRLSTVQDADRILVLHQGRLVEHRRRGQRR